MAKISLKRFVPNNEDKEKGVPAMSKVEILEALTKYKEQNPVKYEAKKEALFAKYGLKESDLKTQEPDSNDVELAELKKKVAK